VHEKWSVLYFVGCGGGWSPTHSGGGLVAPVFDQTLSMPATCAPQSPAHKTVNPTLSLILTLTLTLSSDYDSKRKSTAPTKPTLLMLTVVEHLAQNFYPSGQFRECAFIHPSDLISSYLTQSQLSSFELGSFTANDPVRSSCDQSQRSRFRWKTVEMRSDKVKQDAQSINH